MKLGIIGINSIAALVMAIVDSNENNVQLLLIDDDPSKLNTLFNGHKIAGNSKDLFGGKLSVDKFVVCFGETLLKIKREIFLKLISEGFTPANVIHPSLNKFDSTSIGNGNVIGAGVVVGHETTFGNNCVVFGGTVIEHNTVVNDHCYFGPNVTVSGYCEIGEATLIGSGATILPEIKIGKYCTIGAGAAVTKNIEDYSVVAGVPARIIKKN